MITVDELKEYCIKLMGSLDVLVPTSDERKYTQEEVSAAQTNLRNTAFELLVAATFGICSEDMDACLNEICESSQKIIDLYLNIDFINQQILNPNYTGRFNKEQLRPKLDEFHMELNNSLKILKSQIEGTLMWISIPSARIR